MQHNAGASDLSILAGGVTMVLGGCCTNAWTLERLLQGNPAVGTAITFAQMCFIVLRSFPDFVVFKGGWFPRLKPRAVPISAWLLQVLVLASVSNLNNWAFTFHVPLTLQIVFRSGGLAVSMILGYLFNDKRYSSLQIFSVIVVTVGVILATVLRPTPAKPATNSPSAGPGDAQELYQYAIGVTMMFVASILTGVQGLLQDRTYRTYGKDVWPEGIFYTHLMSLPTFSIFHQDIRRGFQVLSRGSFTPSPNYSKAYPWISSIPFANVPPLYYILLVNSFSQSFCVAGANSVASNSSTITANLLLTIRKAMSLGISVWYFGHGINMGFVIGAIMVLVGTIIYVYAGQINASSPTTLSEKKLPASLPPLNRSPNLRSRSNAFPLPDAHQILRQRTVKADPGQ